MITPHPADDRDKVGPYRLVKAIGAGGSARVDLARIDRAYNFQRHVVIKRPLEHLRGDPKAAASLRREAHIGARLRHPNLVGVLDAGTHDDYDYLVLEYVHGGSLRTLLQADSPARVRDVPLTAALSIVHDVARGLHAAHELADEHGAPLGLVHRDVSPGNILVGLDGAVKLTDFGIAKETRVQTLSGSMHGTVTYMAPEQCRGHAFDRRADVFSLGVVLYELVTGHRLFWADNDVASLHKVLSGNVPRPRKLRPTLSAALEDIVMTAVAHEQGQRFATARDLADAVAHLAAEAGELLAARCIARFVHEVLGPRDEPWVGEVTVVDLPRAPSAGGAGEDASLVELIESVPATEEPPNPTFGPTAPGLPDEVDTQPRRESPARTTRQRKVMAAVVALGLAGGAGAAALMLRDDGAAPRAGEMRGGDRGGGDTSSGNMSSGARGGTDMRDGDVSGGYMRSDDRGGGDTSSGNMSSGARGGTDMRGGDVSGDMSGGDRGGGDTSSGDRGGDVASDSARAKDKRRERDRSTSRRRKGSTSPPATSPPVTTTTEPAKPPPANTGSQSRPAKVEWDPTMLLPTDPRSGTKK